MTAGRAESRESTDRVCARFARAFGGSADAIVRAPGRVNLIGEHVDYNGLAVFPMAIQRAVSVAFRARDDARVRACDVDPAYAPRELEIADEVPLFAQGDWGNYLKAAAQALRLRSRITRGADLAIDGDIPRAAGLASSSALVVACTLALIAVNELEIPPSELMEHCARAERYVGTHSGGMDQAISLGARAGHACVIEFDPIRLSHVPMPAQWRFVIANSLVRAHKSGAAREGYNARTRECREALAGLLDHPRAASWPRTYRGLVEDVTGAELLDLARVALPDLLFRRFRHVVTEGLRVEEARLAMLAGEAVSFGRAMNGSHASLCNDYEVSRPELDDLVAIAVASGAQGARLTGAGFGGCIVALCTAQRVEGVIEALEREYYRGRSVDTDRTLVAVASAGAGLERLG